MKTRVLVKALVYALAAALIAFMVTVTLRAAATLLLLLAASRILEAAVAGGAYALGLLAFSYGFYKYLKIIAKLGGGG